MKRNLFAIGCALIVFLSAMIVRIRFFPNPSHEINYYFTALFSASGIFICIWIAVSIKEWKNSSLPTKTSYNRSKTKNRREIYRIEYRTMTAPKLQVDNCNSNTKRAYLLNLIDLSEKSTQLNHSGLLKTKDRISGQIIFPKGDHIKITGEIIRISGDSAILRFDTPLPSELLINEQRRFLSTK